MILTWFLVMILFSPRDGSVIDRIVVEEFPTRELCLEEKKEREKKSFGRMFSCFSKENLPPDFHGETKERK